MNSSPAPDFLSELSEEAESANRDPHLNNQDALNRLKSLATEAGQIEEWLRRTQERISQGQSRLREIYSREMIDLMDEAGVQDITVDGNTFDAKDYYKASIKVDNPNAEEAYQYLEEAGAGDLLKREVVVTFPKEYQEEAEALAKLAKERYQMASTSLVRSVPWARLTSWVKDRCRAGDVLPLELLGATVGRVVTLRKAREK